MLRLPATQFTWMMLFRSVFVCRSIMWATDHLFTSEIVRVANLIELSLSWPVVWPENTPVLLLPCGWIWKSLHGRGCLLEAWIEMETRGLMTGDGVAHMLKWSVLRGSVVGWGLQNMDSVHFCKRVCTEMDTNTHSGGCTCILIVCWSAKLSVATTVAAISFEERG